MAENRWGASFPLGTILIVVVVALGGLAVVEAIAAGPPSSGGGWMMDQGGWGVMAGVGVAMVILGVLLVALLLYAFVRTVSSPAPTRTAPAESDPITVVRLRYARGEISREEFEQMCRTLASHP